MHALNISAENEHPLPVFEISPLRLCQQLVDETLDVIVFEFFLSDVLEVLVENRNGQLPHRSTVQPVLQEKLNYRAERRLVWVVQNFFAWTPEITTHHGQHTAYKS